MLNEIILQGGMVETPELRHTDNGVAVTSFVVACDRDYQTTEEKQVDFINCVAWNKTAEFASNYFEKGKQIILRGSLQVRKYQNKNGENRYATEVVVEKIWFCGAKEKKSETVTPEFVDVTSDGDLPF